MKIIRKYYLYILSFVLGLGFVSCFGDLNLEPIDPSTIQTFNQDEVFTKVYAAWALTGQQGAAGNNDIDIDDEGRFSLTRSLWNCSELPTDEALCAWGDAEVVTMNVNNFTSLNNSLKAVYARLYFVITISNHFLDETADLTDEKTIKQRAEVRFIRALSYSYLMDFFGNVPFATEIKTEAPQQILRADLFNWIETEVKEVEPDMYDVKAAPYYRVDKAAAWLLLSRIYLNAKVYTGTARWNDAAIYAKKVIDSNYKLATKYKYLFMADNAGSVDGSTVNDAPKEIIFPVAADGIQTKNWGSTIFLINSTRTTGMPNWGTTGSWGGNRARFALVKKFFPNGNPPASDDLTVAAGDERCMMYSTDRTVTISDVTKFKEGISVQKYSNIRADGGATHDVEFPDTDIPFMRSAEAYLTYAEAVLRGAPAAGMTALEAVNALRTRAQASTLLGSQLNLNVVLDEWAREFFFEGRRRTDLIRFGVFTGSDYLWDWKGGASTGASIPSYLNLMPLPADDLNANPNLKQNDGY
ncbi:Starch-binding protein SusD [uncultured Paludibacter sp.]|nr:Starch-binding protein SusD [uncultured Paludibacter sp.]